MARVEAELFNTVAAHRVARGLTQEQMARAIGVSRQTISAIEKGDYNPSTVLALRLAHLLVAPVEQLFSLPASATEDITQRHAARRRDKRDEEGK